MNVLFLVILLLVPQKGHKSHSVSLAWQTTTCSDNCPDHYRVYRTSVSGSYTSVPYASTTALSYQDAAVNAGQVLYYRVTAVNDAGESAPSNEVRAVVPRP